MCPSVTALVGLQPAQVDNPAPASLQHPWYRGPRSDECRVQVGRQNSTPVIIAHLGEGLVGAHRGIVNHDVQMAELRQGLVKQLFQLLAVAHIGQDWQGLPAQFPNLGRHRLHVLAVGSCVHHYVRALPGQGKHDGTADIAAGPGYQGGFSF